MVDLEFTCTCGHKKHMHEPFAKEFEVIESTEGKHPDLSGFVRCSGNNDDCECAIYTEV